MRRKKIYLEPFSEMQAAFRAVHEDLAHLENPFAIGDSNYADLNCRICIGGGDLDTKYKVLEAITEIGDVDFLDNPTGFGFATHFKDKERLYFTYTNYLGFTTVISLNLIGLMNSDVLCLGFKETPEHFDEWRKSTEYDYLSYVKPWLKSKLVVVYGTFDKQDPLFRGLTVLSYDRLCDLIGGFLSKVSNDSSPISAHIGESWPEILDILGIRSRSWFPKGDFVDAMTPVPFVGESGFEALLVGQSLITQGLYEYVMGSNPSHFKGSSDLPVEKVSWFDLLHFCNKLSEMQGFRPCYYDIGSGFTSAEWDRSANGYRLLTEREWSHVAGANRIFRHSGSNDLREVAWYLRTGGRKTHPVGTKKENSFGTYDQSGNLWEWCWDLYHRGGAKRMLRGDSWGRKSASTADTVIFRKDDHPWAETPRYGGRLARSPDQTTRQTRTRT